MAIVTINGNDVSLDDHEQLNVIQAAKRAGVEIPHYCWHPGLSVVASCRMCLVEMGEKKADGNVTMQPRLTPACQMPAKDGTVVVSDSKRVKDAQAATLEYLLLNHPLDCPTCDQAGECWLQDYSYRYGRSESRLREPKIIRPDKDYIGDQITLFTDRCVMCTRCVRFTREFSGTNELEVVSRGSQSEIDIYPGQPCNNKLAGNVVDLCPVGALCSKDFLYKQRVWWLKSRESVCSTCSTGCSIHVDENNDYVYRLRPRENPLAQGHFMCDDGRFGYKYIHSAERLTRPMIRSTGHETNGSGLVGASGGGAGTAVDKDLAGMVDLGSPGAVDSGIASTGHSGPARSYTALPAAPDWSGVLDYVRTRLTDAARSDAAGVVAVFSPWMTCEEAYLLASWLKSLSPAVRLALGPVPIVGEDDHYPKDWRGEAVMPPRFTIRAEKCPNRRGVSAVLAHFQQLAVELDKILADARNDRLSAVYVVHNGPPGWLSAETSAALLRAPLVIAQQILPSELTEGAQVVLPGSSFAEKDGTFVNYSGLAQMIKRSIRCPAEGYTDGRIYMELAGRVGLFNARLLRDEMSREVEYFAGMAGGDLTEYGIPLEAVEPAGRMEQAAR